MSICGVRFEFGMDFICAFVCLLALLLAAVLCCRLECHHQTHALLAHPVIVVLGGQENRENGRHNIHIIIPHNINPCVYPPIKPCSENTGASAMKDCSVGSCDGVIGV
jgi:hypothetical protein